MKEGYLKFLPVKIGENITNDTELQELIILRSFLKMHGLIGILPDGTGYGNVSTKTKAGIIITASQTGNRDEVSPQDFVLVKYYDLHNNKVFYNGIKQPSSETLTHAAVYEANHNAKYIAHFHSSSIWHKLLQRNAKTDGISPYGTVEIALEAKKYVQNVRSTTAIFALSGHTDGVIAYSDEISKLIELVDKNIE